MESACLRIKFSPLIQDTLKSQYCLEIVPQVSCVKNLDKLVWKQETNFIEYEIPMTYRIILKRVPRNDEDIIMKTYYSCVDLLQSPSKLNFDKPDDISRMLSDTLILKQLTSTTPKVDFDHTGPPLSHNRMETNNSETEVFQQTDNENEVVNNDQLELEPRPVEVNAIEKELCDKIINTETTGSISINGNRKLSLSPICSVNTQDNTAAVTNGVICNVTAYRTCDSLKELVPFTSVSASASDAQSSERTSRPNSIKSVHFTSSSRPPPEIRIAQIMQYISKELYPVNLSLNQLRKKCALLGLPQLSLNSQRPAKNKLLLFKPAKPCKVEASNTIISNRAIYTIVYDG